MCELDWLRDHLGLNTSTSSRKTSLTTILSWKNCEGLGKIVVLMLILSLSGCDTIYNYSILIFDMSNFPMDSNLLAILLQFNFSFGYLFAALLVKRLKRKPHFLGSALGLAFTLATLSLGVSKDYFGNDNTFLFEVRAHFQLIFSGLIHSI